MKLTITKLDIFTGAAIAACVYVSYKGFKYAKEKEEEIKAKKKELNDYIHAMLGDSDYPSLIRKASTFNQHLNAHERNIAFDMLDSMYFDLRFASSKNQFDASLEVLNAYLDILLGDDEVAIQSVVEKKIAREANRKLKAQREHELAMAKAAGENEIKIAEIAAEAETSKASLYSAGIKSVAEAFMEAKEAVNERKQESDD